MKIKQGLLNLVCILHLTNLENLTDGITENLDWAPLEIQVLYRVSNISKNISPRTEQGSRGFH